MPNVEIIGFALSTYVRTSRMVCEEGYPDEFSHRCWI